MAFFLDSETTDAAAQVAIVQGWDSNVWQTADNPPKRHPALFTSLEGSVGLVGRGRKVGEGEDLRLFGRFVNYEPYGSSSFESRTGRGGLAYRTSTKLDRLTTFTTTWLGSVGSLFASRGTDGDQAIVDPISSRRTVWNASVGLGFAIEASRADTFEVGMSADGSGTLSETTATGETFRRGLDFVTGRSRFSLTHRFDPRTSWLNTLTFERFHSAYVLPGGNPNAAGAGSIDGAVAVATTGVARALDRRTALTVSAGVSAAVPDFDQGPTVLPIGNATLVHTREQFSWSWLVGFQYGLLQPRIGPGASANTLFQVVGRPIEGRARDTFQIVGELSGQYTGIDIGPNDGSRVVTGGASVMLRFALARSIGLLVGYDLRASRLTTPGAAVDAPWNVRHLAFVGLSFAWTSVGDLPAMTTLARPAAAAFTP